MIGKVKNLVSSILYVAKFGISTVVASYLFGSVMVSFLIYFGISNEDIVGKFAISVVQFLSMGLVLLMIYIISTNKVKKTLHKSDIDKKSLAIGTILAFCLLLVQIAFSLMSSYLGLAQEDNQLTEFGNNNPEFFLIMIPVMILLVGPIEELMFRGYLQGSIRNVTSNIHIPVGLAALLFGLIHLPAIGGIGFDAVPYILIVISLGSVLGYAYEKTENIVVPMLGHGIYNSLIMLIGYTSVKYNIDSVQYIHAFI